MSRVYLNGDNANTNKDLNKISVKGNIGKAEVTYINLYRPTIQIALPKVLKSKQIVNLTINNEILEEGVDYKVSDDKLKIVSLAPEKPWCKNSVTKTAIVGVYTLKEDMEPALTVGDNA